MGGRVVPAPVAREADPRAEERVYGGRVAGVRPRPRRLDVPRGDSRGVLATES